MTWLAFRIPIGGGSFCPPLSLTATGVPRYADSAARVTVMETVRRAGELGVGAPFDLVGERHPAEGLLLFDIRGQLTYANPADYATRDRASISAPESNPAC